jgi:hypothetical protein
LLTPLRFSEQAGEDPIDGYARSIPVTSVKNGSVFKRRNKNEPENMARRMIMPGEICGRKTFWEVDSQGEKRYIYWKGSTEESFIIEALHPCFFNVGIVVRPIIWETKASAVKE